MAPVVRAVLRRERRRRPKLYVWIDEPEPLGEYADHGVRDCVDSDQRAYGLVAASEQVLPEPVAKNHLALLSNLAVLGSKEAAARSGRPEHAEERRRPLQGGEALHGRRFRRRHVHRQSAM